MRIAASVLLAAGLMALSALPAAAHERRDVANGRYQLVVGFLTEPPIQGYPNGVSLRVTNKADNRPVEGVEKTLKVELQTGADKKQMDLEAVFGQPGSYAAHFVPTRAGTYRFVFTGTIEDANINEVFESGPGRFDDVVPLADVQFPPASTDGGGDSAKLNTAQAQAQAALSQAKDTEAKAGTALTVGILGLVVGLIGVGVGAAGFATRRR